MERIKGTGLSIDKLVDGRCEEVKFVVLGLHEEVKDGRIESPRKHGLEGGLTEEGKLGGEEALFVGGVSGLARKMAADALLEGRCGVGFKFPLVRSEVFPALNDGVGPAATLDVLEPRRRLILVRIHLGAVRVAADHDVELVVMDPVVEGDVDGSLNI